MPIFTYTAFNAQKNVVNGKIEASNLKDARESLRKMNLIPTKIQDEAVKTVKPTSTILAKTTVKPKITALPKKEKAVRIKKLSMREKIDFINTLYVLSRTGISIVEALLFVEVNSGSQRIQALSADLRRQILSGSNLSNALAKHPGIFDHIYAGLVRAGEESGELDSTLERIIYLLNKQDKLKNKVTSAMIYPCFILTLASVISIVMITFVFPAFKEVYDGMGQTLPLITRILMNLGTFLRQYWFVIPLSFASIFGFLYFIFHWEVTRRRIDKVALKLPVISTFLKYVFLSNFVNILKVSFSAGVPVLDSMLLANITITNYEIKDAFKDTAAKIQGGQSLSVALKATGVIPGIIMCMISTGEESGQLGNSLEQVEIYIDTQLERVVELMNKLFEPMLLLFIAGIVLVLALALYLPLFRTYANML